MYNTIFLLKGDLEANYQVALDYNFGEGGVKVHFSKAVKWMQRAAHKGHAQAGDNLSIQPEFNASRVLKLGSKGLFQHKATDACNHIAGVVAGIVTLPLLALPGMHLSIKLANKLESRFFELLSLDDERFNLFNYIAWGLSSIAEDELDKHRDFYTHIVGTYAFQGRLRTSKPEYVRFFVDQGMIPRDFTLYQEYSILDPLIELRDKFCETEL